MALTIDFKTATTQEEKLSYLSELKQLVWEEHNAKGLDRQQGKITEQEWLIFKRDVYRPKSFLMQEEKGKIEAKIRADVGTSPKWPTASATDSFEEA